jgi:hypothetical protein
MLISTRARTRQQQYQSTWRPIKEKQNTHNRSTSFCSMHWDTPGIRQEQVHASNLILKSWLQAYSKNKYMLNQCSIAEVPVMNKHSASIIHIVLAFSSNKYTHNKQITGVVKRLRQRFPFPAHSSCMVAVLARQMVMSQHFQSRQCHEHLTNRDYLCKRRIQHKSRTSNTWLSWTFVYGFSMNWHASHIWSS